jgi:hypothetical protein
MELLKYKAKEMITEREKEIDAFLLEIIEERFGPN